MVGKDEHRMMLVTYIMIGIFATGTLFAFPLVLNQSHTEMVQQQQKDKGLVVVGGVHSPEFRFEKNYTNVKNATQTGINRPVIAAGMVEENHTMTTTMKLDTTQIKQIDKSQFIKAPGFAQISGYINTPNNNSPLTLCLPYLRLSLQPLY